MRFNPFKWWWKRAAPAPPVLDEVYFAKFDRHLDAGETFTMGSREEMAAYRRWRERQVCIDCGRNSEQVRAGHAGEGDHGPLWMNERQCSDCWEKNGHPQNRTASYLEVPR